MGKTGGDKKAPASAHCADADVLCVILWRCRQTKISDMLDEDETETNQQGGEDEEDEEDDEGTCDK